MTARPELPLVAPYSFYHSVGGLSSLIRFFLEKGSALALRPSNNYKPAQLLQNENSCLVGDGFPAPHQVQRLPPLAKFAFCIIVSVLKTPLSGFLLGFKLTTSPPPFSRQKGKHGNFCNAFAVLCRRSSFALIARSLPRLSALLACRMDFPFYTAPLRFLSILSHL